MQGMKARALRKAGNRIKHALACAGGRTGLCSTSLKLSMVVVKRNFMPDLQGQPKALASPTILANMVCSDLEFDGYAADSDDVGPGPYLIKMVRRSSDVVAARLCCGVSLDVSALMPLMRLRHLDMDWESLEPWKACPLGKTCQH